MLDICEKKELMVNETFSSLKLLEGINETLITLILKTNEAISIQQF